MKKILALALSIVLALALTACGETPAATTAAATTAAAETTAAAAETTAAAAEVVKMETPVLITTAGLGGNGSLVNTMMGKVGLSADAYKLDNEATAATLTGYKTLIVVISASNKGLGAAGVSVADENARIAEMTDAAKKAGIKILAMHIGGTDGRGPLGDQLIETPINACDYAIIVKAGDANDGMVMSELLAAKGTGYSFIDKASGAVDVLKAIFA